MKVVCIKTCQSNKYGVIKERQIMEANEVSPALREYFIPLEGEVPTIKKQEREEIIVKEEIEEINISDDDDLETLRTKADKLKMGYDRRWGFDRLKQEIKQRLKGM